MPAKSYLERKTADKTLTVMDWSTELNIIEAVWDHLDRERNKGQHKYQEELWEVLYNIPEEYYRKLQDSLTKTAQDVQREVQRNTRSRNRVQVQRGKQTMSLWLHKKPEV